MSVSVLTMDIEVAEPLEAWTQVGNDIDGAVASGQLGYSVSMNSDGTRMAIGQPHWSPGGAVRVFQYDTASLGWQQAFYSTHFVGVRLQFAFGNLKTQKFNLGEAHVNFVCTSL